MNFHSFLEPGGEMWWSVLKSLKNFEFIDFIDFTAFLKSWFTIKHIGILDLLVLLDRKYCDFQKISTFF